jgi:hypothetical protein
MGDAFDVGNLLVGSQEPHRDGVFGDVKTKMDPAKMGDTGHGRLLP